MMWLPVVLGPVGAAAGVAGFFSQPDGQDRAADRLGGDRRQRPAGHLPARPRHRAEAGRLANARYNLEMGPPLLAPLLVTMVGGMGLLAAVLRREQ